MRALITVLMVAAAGCAGARASDSLTGSVTDTAHEPVAGATVFAIPAALVTWSPLAASDVSSTATADFDEPLERLIDAQGASFPQAVTDDQGEYALPLPAGRYYFYVDPDTTRDAVHLPGGTASRVSQSADALLAAGRLDIKLSSMPSSFDPRNYIGAETCLGCHANQATWKRHAHANGIHEPGKAAPLQTQARIDLVDAPMLAKFAANTTLYFYAYDGTRGDDKFKVQEGGIAPDTSEFSFRLFQDGNQYKVEFRNLLNSAQDPVHGQSFVIEFFYGGMLMKQRMIARLNVGPNPPISSNHYFIFPPVTLQPGGTTMPPLGNDRQRWPWKDERAADFWDEQAKRFKAAALTESFDAQCSSCHFTGYSIDPKTLESTAQAAAGGIPWKTPGQRIEGNLGCEFCHGPGKEHRAAALAGRPGQFIVQPGLLAAEREMSLCGQCHSRPVGNDSLGLHNQPPLNQANAMAPPGIRRKIWRQQYTTRPDGDPRADFWDDGVHSRKNRQQFSDLMKSKKYANPRMLVACTNCHDIHAGTTDPVKNPRGLVASIEDNSLCAMCHASDDLNSGPGATYHQLHTAVGTLRPDAAFRCVNCHMDKVARTGAGQPRASDATHQYFENDIRDHSFQIPRRDNPGVADYTLGQAAMGQAMPIPYTRTCGACHQLGTIANKP
jgi:predicted CXXCH cytochrome family protein